ncbi:MAG: DJ-1 family glyoxalase III [Sphaerochaetaceae bacterium]|jgi:4-methyl-5(b-hydroxyethyl)-thiazole monophosphate biosynthesis
MVDKKKRVLVVLANGFEEIEAITPIDLLRRANFEVVVAGVGSKELTGAHNITVQADQLIEDVGTDFDALVLPGGALGAENLSKSWEVNEKMLLIFNSGAVLAAICAAPAVVVAPTGLLRDRKAVCYPGSEQFAPDVEFGEESVVVDGNLITARGPGFAIDFSLAIIEKLGNKKLRDDIAKKILVL